MVAKIAETVYFTNAGSENTEDVLRIASRRAKELNIKNILVASSFGETAVKAIKILKGLRVIIVSHVTGHHEPNVQQFTQEHRQKVESKGGLLLTTREAFDELNAEDHDNPIANTLRMFGQGTKVACEISIMAADAGLVRTDEDIIAIAGRHRGADTALVLKPANSTRLFELRVKQILCKPLSTSVGIYTAVCTGCNKCVKACLYGVLVRNPEKGKPPRILHPDKCAICYCCIEACRVPGAIGMEHPLKPSPHQRVRSDSSSRSEMIA